MIFSNNKYILILLNFILDEDEYEVYNNPNIHSEEQDELEIPDSKFFFNL